MKDYDKTKEQLIAELDELRGRVSALEASETEWRRTEEALQESEERFRLLVEAIPQPIWRSDADGNVMEFNRRWHDYTGQTAEEAKGSGWTKALHSDEAAMVVQKVRAGITSGAAIEIVNRLRRASDGSYRWHLARAVPMNDSGGKIIGWFGCATDIDDQKRAEKELTKSKAVLRAAIDCLPFNFFAIGLDGRYMLQNAVSKAQQGGDAIGKLPEEVCRNNHDLAIYLNNNRRAFAGEKVEGEVTLSLGGEERFYYNVVAPIRDGEELHGILGVNIDITESKRAKEELHKAHNELERRVQERTAELSKANESLSIFLKFAEASGEGFGMSDFVGRIVYANPTLCRMFGEEKPEDVIGKNVSSYYPEDLSQRRKNEMIPALLQEGDWYVEQTVLAMPRKTDPDFTKHFLDSGRRRKSSSDCRCDHRYHRTKESRGGIAGKRGTIPGHV